MSLYNWTFQSTMKDNHFELTIDNPLSTTTSTNLLQSLLANLFLATSNFLELHLSLSVKDRCVTSFGQNNNTTYLGLQGTNPNISFLMNFPFIGKGINEDGVFGPLLIGTSASLSYNNGYDADVAVIVPYCQSFSYDILSSIRENAQLVSLSPKFHTGLIVFLGCAGGLIFVFGVSLAIFHWKKQKEKREYLRYI
eukprot:TRINITY_DN531_c0_g1_i8.p1 TRINITY_DN531_c0_g1~~TRINITY_DN531_c0_g1_i8.p1  ORF type:complete len:195 (-),score=37.95 TRINITY_DN531_c0_g1_i8:566-1150(-)